MVIRKNLLELLLCLKIYPGENTIGVDALPADKSSKIVISRSTRTYKEKLFPMPQNVVTQVYLLNLSC